MFKDIDYYQKNVIYMRVRKITNNEKIKIKIRIYYYLEQKIIIV